MWSKAAAERDTMKVIVVGCGLGGLSCAISCLQEGLEVEILEKAAEIGEIGAGIQIPPNATRMMTHYGLMERLRAAGAVRVEQHEMLRYFNGEVIATKPDSEWWRKQFGHYHYVIHRADYHRVLYERARELGATIHLKRNVVDVDHEAPCAVLEGGEREYADVIIGADGLWSSMRSKLMGCEKTPEETGDMAYRATIPRRQIEQLGDASILDFVDGGKMRNWVGPDRHAVLYPVRDRNQFNLVLLRPDNLPPDIPTAVADVQEMRDAFENWDPRLTTIISRIDQVLKWKIRHMSDLSSWTKGSAALLGDACHPSLPYQAQGAAMAVEDGATLGVLLGQLQRDQRLGSTDRRSYIPDMLQLYEGLRKERTTLNVEGSAELRTLFHMHDGPEADARNAELRSVDWNDENNNCRWNYANLKHQKDLMMFDAVGEAKARFEAWAVEQGFE